jgi:putative membrane protein
MVKSQKLSPEDVARLEQKIGKAEAQTSGEIYVVIAQSPDDFRLVPVFWAAIFVLLFAWGLHIFTNLSTATILILQGLAFVAASALLSPRAIRYRIVPWGIAEEAAHRAAMAQFMAHGVHLTAERTGVLIYVCMFPRRIEIVADSGIHAKVDQQTWDNAVRKIAAEARSGRLSDGLAQVIQDMGGLLATRFPRQQADCNELPDRVIQL